MKINYVLLLLFLSIVTKGQQAFDTKEVMDFSLQAAIDYALEHSYQSKLNALEVKNADAKITEFRANGLPQVTAGVDYNHYFFTPATPIEDFISPIIYGVLENEFPGEVTTPAGDPQYFEFSFFTKNNLTAKVDASMLLFDGSYLVGLKAAKLYKELAKKSKDVDDEKIKEAVTKAYMNILITEENKKTLQTNLENISTSVKEAEAYYENGFIENLEVKRIKLAAESITTEIEKLDQLIELSKQLLKFQMSYPSNNKIILNEDLEALVNSFSAEKDLTETEIDFQKKAQYREIELGQELNALNVDRIKKGYLPSLAARAGASEALQRNKLFDNAEGGWIPTLFAGLSLNVPITDGKRKKGQLQQAEIEMQKGDIQKAEYQRAALMQINTSRLQHKNAKKTLLNTKRILEVNEEIYDTTLIKFREGVGSSLEVTQAQNSLDDAQASYINALYNLLITKTDLDIALGDL